MAVDISAIDIIIVAYNVAMMAAAISRPPHPPAFIPKFQPKNSPEITDPTPRPHSSTGPATRRNLRSAR